MLRKTYNDYLSYKKGEYKMYSTLDYVEYFSKNKKQEKEVRKLDRGLYR